MGPAVEAAHQEHELDEFFQNRLRPRPGDVHTAQIAVPFQKAAEFFVNAQRNLLNERGDVAAPVDVKLQLFLEVS